MAGYIQNPANWTAMAKPKGFDPSSIAFKPAGGSGGRSGPKAQTWNPQAWGWGAGQQPQGGANGGVFNWNPQAFNGGANPESWMMGLMSHYLPMLMSQGDFMAKLEPQRQNEYQRLITNLNPANQQRNIDKVYRDTLKTNRQKLRSGVIPGLSDSYRKAMELDAHNKAAEQAGAFSSYLMSPEGMSAASNALTAAIAGGQSMPWLQAMLGLQAGHNSALGVEFGRPKETNMFGGILGNVLGQAVGGFDWTSLFGKKK